jgi:PAS domain S-box-containing protein
MNSFKTPVSIIVIDPNPQYHTSVSKLLLVEKTNISSIVSADNLKDGECSIYSIVNSVVLIDDTLCGEPELVYLSGLIRKFPKTPFIVLSSSDNNKRASKCLSSGAQDFLVKGKFTGRQLIDVIAKSLQRKYYARTLEDNLSRFQLVCKAMNMMVWDWDLHSGKIFRSEEGWKMIFKSQTVPAGNNEEEWVEKLHPDDRDTLNRLKQVIMQSVGQNIYEIESRVLQDDDTYGYVLDRGYVIRDTERRPVRVVGGAQDITGRKLVENQVLLSERRFRSLIQNGSDLIAIWKKDGDFLYMSSASKKILGYEPEFFQGKNIENFIHASDYHFVKGSLGNISSGEAVKINPYRFRNAMGEWRWLETTLTDLTTDESVNGVVSNSRDITQRMEADELAVNEKRKKQNEITEAIISAQEQLRSSIGRELHDNINQLLGAIRLYIDMARKDSSNFSSYLASASEFTLNAIDEIRKLSKTLITPLLQGLSLEDAVLDMIDDISRVHPIKIKFNSKNFDEQYLKEEFKLNVFRIIQEQINNVLKHSQAKAATISLRNDIKNLRLTVKDNGIGYDTESRKRGIGLTNIISRAELYKGEVMIDTAAEKGCRLNILFPDAALYNV